MSVGKRKAPHVESPSRVGGADGSPKDLGSGRNGSASEGYKPKTLLLHALYDLT